MLIKFFKKFTSLKKERDELLAEAKLEAQNITFKAQERGKERFRPTSLRLKRDWPIAKSKLRKKIMLLIGKDSLSKMSKIILKQSKRNRTEKGSVVTKVRKNSRIN